VKIPRINSRSWKILKAFAENRMPMTFDSALAIHGNAEHVSKTRAEYDDHVAVGNLIQVGEFYKLSTPVRHYFDSLGGGEIKPVNKVVQPRAAVPFTAMGKYSLGIQCGRPGAMDYQKIPSLMGGERVAYQSACAKDDAK